MKMTKKQWLIGGAVSLVLAGGSAGIVANNQAQAQAEKTAQAAKRAHDNRIKEAKKATEKAETFKAEADVKSAQEAIKKLDEKDKTDLIARVEKVQKNWDLVNRADKSVTSAEKAKTDAAIKTAQTAIDKLKEKMTTSKKAELQKRLDKVKATLKAQKEKAQAEAKKKAQETAAAEAKAKAQTAIAQSEAQASSSNTAGAQNTTPAPSTDIGAYTQEAQAPAYSSSTPQAPAPSPSAPAGNGGGSVAPSTPNPPASSGNSGGSQEWDSGSTINDQKTEDELNNLPGWNG